MVHLSERASRQLLDRHLAQAKFLRPLMPFLCFGLLLFTAVITIVAAATGDAFGWPWYAIWGVTLGLMFLSWRCPDRLFDCTVGIWPLHPNVAGDVERIRSELRRMR